MPPPRAPIGRSSSRSSRTSDDAGRASGPARTHIAVAEVLAAHGLRGFVRARPFHWPAPSLSVGREVVLERGAVSRQARIAVISPIPRGRLLLAFAGIADRNAAEALAGHRILVAEADLPPLGADEFY